MSTEEKLTLLLEFLEHVRRTGDTRLASMAIATLNKIKGLSLYHNGLCRLYSSHQPHIGVLQMKQAHIFWEVDNGSGHTAVWAHSLDDAKMWFNNRHSQFGFRIVRVSWSY